MYTALAQGIAPTSIEPMSEPGLRIVGSALLAFVASTAVFYALHIEHPMAYVTAFTATIGAFPSIQALVVVGGAILCVVVFRLFDRRWDLNLLLNMVLQTVSQHYRVRDSRAELYSRVTFRPLDRCGVARNCPRRVRLAVRYIVPATPQYESSTDERLLRRPL